MILPIGSYIQRQSIVIYIITTLIVIIHHMMMMIITMIIIAIITMVIIILITIPHVQLSKPMPIVRLISTRPHYKIPTMTTMAMMMMATMAMMMMAISLIINSTDIIKDEAFTMEAFFI